MKNLSTLIEILREKQTDIKRQRLNNFNYIIKKVFNLNYKYIKTNIKKLKSSSFWFAC